MSDQDVMALAREALAGDAASLVRLIAAIVRTQEPIEPPTPQSRQRIQFSNFYCAQQDGYGRTQHQGSIEAPPHSAVPQWQLAWTHLVTGFVNQLLEDAARRGVKIVKPGDWMEPNQANGHRGSHVSCEELCR